MKIALISDVHANGYALRAVLRDARNRDCRAVWNLGDFLGYGPQPEEVVRELRDRPGAVNVIGNYDLKVLRFARKPKSWPRPKSPAKFFAFHWAYVELSEDSREFLSSLPRQRRLQIGRHRVLLSHAGPEGVEADIGPQLPEEYWRGLASQARADVVLYGHTHRADRRAVDRCLFVNPGTVGRCDDGDPRASYAVLDFAPAGVNVEFRRVDYDVTAAADLLRRRGMPEAFAEMLLQGRNLNAIIGRMTRRSPQDANPLAGDEQRLQAVLSLAETCHYESEHAWQVTFLALRLFDELQAAHCLGAEARQLLQFAGLLHDIGWLEGQQKHHKVSRELIQDAAHLPLNDRERAIVANVARYHRKALPKDGHASYAALQEGDRHTVDVLASLLRVADGLDRSHRSVVSDLHARAGRQRIEIEIEAGDEADEEIAAARKKGDLLERTFQKRMQVRRAAQPASAGEDGGV